MGTVSPADPRAACVVGVAQIVVRPPDGPAPEPLEMWERAARAAAEDAGSVGLLARVESLQVVYCQSWDYDDPAGRLASRLGISPRDRRYSGIGGTVPQVLLADIAGRIGRRELDVALVGMAEAGYTVRKAGERGEPLAWSHGVEVPVRFPLEAAPLAAEVAHGVHPAWLTFAMRDVARRARQGESPDAYRAGLGRMMSGLTQVAATNPYAWFPVARTASELTDRAPENRMIGYPYTKRMCSILDVDQAAAVMITSDEAADRAGVPRDRRVYLHGAAYAEDPVYVAEHEDLSRSPAMALAGRLALEAGGIGVDDVGHLDLYSCFPASLGFALDALGMMPDDQRPLTVTGGLPYAGGPGSGYMVASVAAMIETLRKDPGSYGLVSGVGMHMTKHVYGLYSTRPPARSPLVGLDRRGRLRGNARTIAEGVEGEGTVATYSVIGGRDGQPRSGVVIVDLADGRRAYAVVIDPTWLARAEAEELTGSTVVLRSDPRGFAVAYA